MWPHRSRREKADSRPPQQWVVAREMRELIQLADKEWRHATHFINLYTQGDRQHEQMSNREDYSFLRSGLAGETEVSEQETENAQQLMSILMMFSRIPETAATYAVSGRHRVTADDTIRALQYQARMFSSNTISRHDRSLLSIRFRGCGYDERVRERRERKRATTARRVVGRAKGEESEAGARKVRVRTET